MEVSGGGQLGVVVTFFLTSSTSGAGSSSSPSAFFCGGAAGASERTRARWRCSAPGLSHSLSQLSHQSPVYLLPEPARCTVMCGVRHA